MSKDDQQDWLVELLRSDPEDPGLRQALHLLTADGGAPQSQLSTVCWAPARQAAGHGFQEQLPTAPASGQSSQQSPLEPSSQLPLIPCLSSDDLQFLEALHAEGHLYAPDPDSELSPEKCGIPSEMADRAQATKRQTYTASELARLPEDQIVPSDGVASGSFGIAVMGGQPLQASSSKKADQQGLAHGWKMHRELLLRREAHQRALQKSSISQFPSDPLHSSDHPLSESVQRHVLASNFLSAPRHPDIQETPLPRRQNAMPKLPGGISLRYRPGEGWLRQQQGNKQAVQSKDRLLSARNEQEAAAFETRHSSSVGHEGLKRGRDYQYKTMQGQQSDHNGVPCPGPTSQGLPQPHRQSCAAPSASTPVDGRHTAGWQSQRSQQYEQTEAPSAKRLLHRLAPEAAPQRLLSASTEEADDRDAAAAAAAAAQLKILQESWPFVQLSDEARDPSRVVACSRAVGGLQRNPGASERVQATPRRNNSRVTTLKMVAMSRKHSQDKLPHAMKYHFPRDLSKSGEWESLDLSVKAANSELASLQQSKEAIQKSIETLFMKQQVLEAAERTVHRLMTQLNYMRMNPEQSLTFKIEDVISLVYSINLARGVDSEGYGSYISSQYAKRCLALPFASSGTGWDRKKDTSGKHSAMEMAFAFAAGDKTAGEVELELTAKSLKGQKLKFKDLVKLSTKDIQDLFDKSALAAAEIVFQAVKLDPWLEERKSLESAINLIGTEGLCISHIHYVFSPLHYRSPESWKFKPQRGASLRKDAAHVRARESLESSGADMGSLESLWRDRGINLEPLELRQAELRDEIAQHFQSLQAQVSNNVDFTELLETVKHFKLSLDEAAVINSVAVTASNICVLNSWQMAQAVAASYPHVMNYEILHALGNVY